MEEIMKKASADDAFLFPEFGLTGYFILDIVG